MKRFAAGLAIISIMAAMGVFYAPSEIYADEGGDETTTTQDEATTKLTITPVSKTFQLSSNSTYDGVLTVTNDGKEEMRVSVYASPYFYSYSEQDKAYRLGFNTENNYTQIARWITVKDSTGNYVNKSEFVVPGKDDEGKLRPLNIEYRITTPSSIPAGGQYAALFVQTLTGRTNQSGIHTETSAGMTIYGHSTEGESIVKADIKDPSISFGKKDSNKDAKSYIYATAMVKNEGNTDFYARGKLKVEPIIGFGSYETEGSATTSIIPDAELPVEDKWMETPDFGIYKATWTVTVGETEETVEQIIYIINPIIIILAIIILTIVIVLVIIGVRRSKERKSRLAV